MKAILHAIGSELIAQGHDKSTVRRALATVGMEEAEDALADALAWAEDVVDSASEEEVAT
jgi:hypothetical protein